MSIQLTSTTDSPEAVRAAMGLPPVEEKAKEESEPTDEVEQKEASESETEETEASEATEESEEQEDSEESVEEKPKKKGGFQRRIDKLNAKAAAKDAEIERLKSLLSEKNGEKPVEQEKPVKAEGKPSADDFETHAEYVEALTDWKLEQREKEAKEKAEQMRAKSEAETVMKSHSERVAQFSEKHEDFHEVLEGVDDIAPSLVLLQLIVSSDNGPELMYELAKNREEYERINKLSPIAVARELGKLESKLAAPASEQKQEQKKLTKAPKPLEPVSKAAKTASTKSPDSMNYEEFKKWREEQLKRN